LSELTITARGLSFIHQSKWLQGNKVCWQV